MFKKVIVLMMLIFFCTVFIQAADSRNNFFGQEKEVLKLDLPKPMFVGTPKNIRSPNLERVTGKKRGDFFVPLGTVLLSLNKPVASSDMEPVIGEIDFVTDGEKSGEDGYYVELGPGLQYVQIDLEGDYALHAILIWHYHSQARVYRDVVVQVSNDPDFIDRGRSFERIIYYINRIIAVVVKKDRIDAVPDIFGDNADLLFPRIGGRKADWFNHPLFQVSAVQKVPDFFNQFIGVDVAVKSQALVVGGFNRVAAVFRR